MRHFSSSITIRARPEVIWGLITDAAGYPRWNSTVERIDGRIASGEKLTVYAKISPGRAFPVRVTEFARCERMVWTGGMPLGLFTGARSYTLTPGPGGAVAFSMREYYSGLLAPLITRLIPDLQPAFEIFATDLKHGAETAARQANAGD